MSEESLRRAVAFFESIRPEDAQRMDALYADDAWFKDPWCAKPSRRATRPS